ncbi:metallophosphoesterase [Metabacillus sp. RGM 3146]|uniref:metallophosphoesterase n=1 Tax=Metabacillus sp. RGM 3146 TaxID=3401092 RepID=UPI003B9C535F
MVYAIIAFALALLLGGWMLINAFRNTLTENHLFFPEFPLKSGQLTILFISDIHRRIISEKLLKQFPSQADIVLIGGDLAEKGVPLKRIRENVKKLSAYGPVAAVMGNNDFELEQDQLMTIFKEEKIHLLHNSAIIAGKPEIQVIGLGEMKFNQDDLELGLKSANDKAFKILLCHNPNIIEKLRPEHNIFFCLSGHTHGGQIRFGKFGLYEKGKVFKRKETTILISNGYGTSKLPLRLGAPAEAHFITIKKS